MSGNKVVKEIDSLVQVRTVLASVSDKRGLEILVPALLEHCPGVKIISTSGTHRRIGEILEKLGTSPADHLMEISDYTGNPEIAGGLVKTLSYQKSLGLLTYTYWDEHQQSLRDQNVVPIDVVACNLYPFQETVAKEGVTPEQAREQIDIGGPNMVREAAKNYTRCASIVDPADYPGLVAEIEKNQGAMGFGFRLRCAKKAFRHVADYNTAIADYLDGVSEQQALACYKTVHERSR
jgi:phosphoribosylaminoimidazolecarboxamide formyltransferase/IMP cyclohydrolase